MRQKMPAYWNFRISPSGSWPHLSDLKHHGLPSDSLSISPHYCNRPVFSPADCLLSIVPIAAAEKRTLSNLLESVLSKMLIHRTCTGNVPVYCPVCCQTIVFSICFLQKPLPYVIQSFCSFMVRINSTPYF